MQIFICRSSLEAYKQDIMQSNHPPKQTNKKKNIAQSLQPRTGKRLFSFHSQRSLPGLLTDIFHHIKQPVSTPRLLDFIPQQCQAADCLTSTDELTANSGTMS